jgi:hypothetical protein
MGGTRNSAGRKQKRKGPSTGQWEWEYERSTATSALSDAELADFLTLSTTDQLHNGHLLSSKELFQFRKILKAKNEDWPDEKLHRHIDELAVNIGLRIKDERTFKAAQRHKEIENKFLPPARQIVGLLTNTETSKELRQPWGGFTAFDHEDYLAKTITFIEACEIHIAKIKSFSRSGKEWDSDLKVRFVELVSMLCEFINHDFEPTRKNQDKREELTAFSDVADMLGKPIFGDADFVGAIRQLVDRWNSSKKELATQLQPRKSVAEKPPKA